MNIFILFSVDLYKNIKNLINTKVFIVEDEHYFNRKNMKFNILKPIFHRASMKYYYDYLNKKNIDCNYIDISNNWINAIGKYKYKKIIIYDPVDRVILKKIYKHFSSSDIEIIDTPRFILSNDEMNLYNGALRQTSFYSWIRKYKNILIDGSGEPVGGKLTYDNENRKKPYQGINEDIKKFNKYENKNYNNKYVSDAYLYVIKKFNKNTFINYQTPEYINLKFPINHVDTLKRVKNFVKNILNKFGDYQDVILYDENNSFIFHSAISPMLNIGLITPNEIVKIVLKYYQNMTNKNKMLNNVEGFIRQIIGWREFSRYMYEKHSSKYINKNFFNAKNKLNKEWYNGTTGILPIDITIKKAFKYGYLHHIERLMIIANYMTLIGYHPTEMYKWFMEFSIDSYDWVMEYNIYCMASYSDGGKFTSKPYISSSKYIIKMSNYNKYNNDLKWTEKWDQMFWKFMKKHKNKIKKIGRLAMLLKFI
jgi:deoxyribodipyrimidine photolyase-related protein